MQDIDPGAFWYASRRRLYLRRVVIAESCQFPKHRQTAATRIQQGIPDIS